MTAAAILWGLGCGLLYVAFLFVVALALGSMISRADRDAEALDGTSKPAAEPYLSAEVRAALAGDDWIGRMIEQGGASDFQHDGSFNK